LSERCLTQPWNKARIKFVARFPLAIYAMRTVNLSILATAFSGHAKEESNYKRLQRFLREFEMPYAELALFIVKLLGVPGPYTLALDRTNWKDGTLPERLPLEGRRILDSGLVRILRETARAIL
jgi:hypothetical protein